MSGTVSALDAPTGGIGGAVGHDLAVAAVWAGIGAITTCHAVVRLRRGLRRDAV